MSDSLKEVTEKEFRAFIKAYPASKLKADVIRIGDPPVTVYFDLSLNKDSTITPERWISTWVGKVTHPYDSEKDDFVYKIITDPESSSDAD